jgi:hypothetical protein
MVRFSARFSLIACAIWLVLGASPLWAAVPTEFQPNYDHGYGIGYPIGHNLGLVQGKAAGVRQGTDKGTSEGFSTGWSSAYSPAYDLAYDARYPVGHRAGWDRGLSKGFDEGFDYAPVFVATVLSQSGNWSNWGGSSSSGILNISMSGVNTYAYNSILGLELRGPDPNYDWSKHYQNEGYNAGRETGLSVGHTEGYNLTYPFAYAAAYKIAFVDGVGEGTIDGTRDGRKEGYDEGWDAGYDGGFDLGFDAGLSYHLYGDFVEPRYALQYSRRSDASTLLTLRALQAPEPTGLMLVGIGAVAGVMVWPRRGW